MSYAVMMIYGPTPRKRKQLTHMRDAHSNKGRRGIQSLSVPNPLNNYHAPLSR